MKKLILLLFSFVLIGCCPCKKLQPSYQEKVRYETIIKENIDTVFVELPKEYVEVFRQDSSFIETSVAWSEAKVDSSGLLHHTISNKNDVPVKTITKEVEVVRDSIVVKEVPYEVVREKVKYPNSYWIMLLFIVFIIGTKVYGLFKYIV